MLLRLEKHKKTSCVHISYNIVNMTEKKVKWWKTEWQWEFQLNEHIINHHKRVDFQVLFFSSASTVSAYCWCFCRWFIFNASLVDNIDSLFPYFSSIIFLNILFVTTQQCSFSWMNFPCAGIYFELMEIVENYILIFLYLFIELKKLKKMRS